MRPKSGILVFRKNTLMTYVEMTINVSSAIKISSRFWNLGLFILVLLYAQVWFMSKSGSGKLGADFVFVVFAFGVVFDVFDDFFGDVAAGDAFDAEARGGVDFKDEGSAGGAHDVDAGDVEAHGLGGVDGDFLFGFGEFDAGAFATFVEVGAEVVVEGLAFHGGDDAGADHEGADVGAGGFLDVFLEEDVGAVLVVEVEGLEGGLGGFFGFSQNYAIAVRAGGEFDDDGEADLVEQVIDVGDGAGDQGFRGVDAVFGEDLSGAQLVASAGDSDRAGGGPDALHFELTDDGAAVFGHAVADAREDGVVAFDFFAVVKDVRVFFVQREVAVFVLDDFCGVAAFFGFLDEAFGTVIAVAV